MRTCRGNKDLHKIAGQLTPCIKIIQLYKNYTETFNENNPKHLLNVWFKFHII